MFDDQIAIVTGGESGIGAACASALGAAGARVALTYYRDEAAAQAICQRIGGAGRAVAIQTDVGDETAVEALFVASEQAFGTATLLVNSAGFNMTGTIWWTWNWHSSIACSAPTFTARSSPAAASSARSSQ